MLDHITLLLIDILLSLYALLFILRGLLAFVRADFYNPLSQFIVKATKTPISFLRKLLPLTGRFDFPCWVLAYVVIFVETVLSSLIKGYGVGIFSIAVFSAIQLISTVLMIYIFSLIIIAISSWFMSGAQALRHPVISLVYSISNPLLIPIRRILPNTQPLDFSVFAALLLLYILQTILHSLL